MFNMLFQTLTPSPSKAQGMTFQKAKKTPSICCCSIAWNLSLPLPVTVGEEGMAVPEGRQVTGIQTPIQRVVKVAS